MRTPDKATLAAVFDSKLTYRAARAVSDLTPDEMDAVEQSYLRLKFRPEQEREMEARAVYPYKVCCDCPCDGCGLADRCGIEGLACPEYYKWVVTRK